MVTDYIVLQERDNSSMADTVKRYLSNGWECQGGVSVSLCETDDHCYQVFAQAMVKVEPMGEMP